MNTEHIVFSLVGGAFIGLSATIMLLFNGRVTGISGIIAASLTKSQQNNAWRLLFVAGLICGGVLVQLIRPDFFANTSGRSATIVAIAGLLVGFGTVMGSGCTSGHGICGISRLSMRSILATLTFMLFGFLTVVAFRFFTGGSV